jgi:hypothetical protein
MERAKGRKPCQGAEERDVLLSDLVLFILRLQNLTNTEVGDRLVQLESGNVALLAGIAHASSLVRVEGERDRLDEDGAGVEGSIEVDLVLNELEGLQGVCKDEVRRLEQGKEVRKRCVCEEKPESAMKARDC